MKNTIFAETKQITKRASASSFKPRILTLVLFFVLPVFWALVLISAVYNLWLKLDAAAFFR